MRLYIDLICGLIMGDWNTQWRISVESFSKNNSLPCSVLDKILDIIIDLVPDAELRGDKDWSFERDNLSKFWAEIEKRRSWSLFKIMSISDPIFSPSKSLILLIGYLLISTRSRRLGPVLKFAYFKRITEYFMLYEINAKLNFHKIH